MLALRLTREMSNEHCCRGRLEVIDVAGELSDTLYTIEKPWLPDKTGKGGTPFRSCIAAGTYALSPYTRPNGDRVWILSNPALDVFKLDTDIPHARRGRARYLILIHAANYAREVVGCIAPGMGWRTNRDGTVMVTSSREAMRRLHVALNGRRGMEMEVGIVVVLKQARKLDEEKAFKALGHGPRNDV